MKRILFVLPYLSGGGAERVVSIWADEMSKIGCDVSILLFYRVSNEYLMNPNVKIYTLKDCREEYKKLSLLNKIKKLRKNLKDINPDIIIPFISYVGVMTSLAKIGLNMKIVETIRIDPRYSPKDKKMKFLRNLSVLCSTRCIVQNENQKEYFPFFIKKKIKIFPNPIAEDFVLTTPKKYQQTIKNLVAVGRLEEQKNYFLLIDSFSEVIKKEPNLTLKIYGEGSLREELNGYIAYRGLQSQVLLCGRQSSIISALSNADAYILSSNAEGMPNSLMEAMCMGLPCISTDCPTGPKELIEHEKTGLLVPVGDKAEMVKAIYRLIENVEFANELGKNARKEIIKNYHPEKSAKLLRDFLNAI